MFCQLLQATPVFPQG